MMAPAIDLHQLLPVYKVENSSLLSAKGDVTIAWEITLPEIFTLSNQQYEAFHQTWIKAIKLLPKNSIFHKQDWFMADAVQADYSKENLSFLDRASERFFQQRPFLNHRCYLMITQKPKDRKEASSLFSNLLRRSIVPQITVNPALMRDFLDSAGQVERVLSDSGFIKMRRLGDDELAGTQATAGLLENYLQLHAPGELPVLKDVSLENGFQIGSNHCQLYTLSDVEDLPALCGSRTSFDKYSTDKTKFGIGFASPLGQLLSCNHIFNQYLFIGDTNKTLKILEAKRRRLQSLSAYSRENAIARDATQDFLNEAISQQRLPVKAHFNVLVWTDRKEALKDLRNSVASAMSQMDGNAKEETAGLPQIWWAGLPGNEADFPMNDTFETFAEQASCFLNLETGYRSSISPVGIRFGDRLAGRPLNVDLSDLPMKQGLITNRNKFILGPSGSGKSFLTNHLMRTYYEQGAHIVLVDVGHSYRGLCDFVQGYYFTYEEKNPIRFNPFYIGKGDSLDTEKRESIKTLLLALWKKDDEVYGRSEYVALSNALQGYFDKLAKEPGLFPCFNTFYEYLKTEFIAALKQDNVKEKDFDIDNFLYVLRPYYRGGEFDYLLNATENLDLLQMRFIVFELDNIKDHPILFPVVTLIIMEVFISKMRKLKGIRKIILIEEAWKAIAKEGMAEYIKYLFKTVRKFFGEAVVVTQDIEDIISSPVVKQAIINNADCKILLDQSKYLNKFDMVQELLGLDDSDKAQILSMNKANEPGRFYKEVYISPFKRVYRVEVSPEEYYTYTTEETEKLKVQQYTARYGGDIRKAIAALVAEQQP